MIEREPPYDKLIELLARDWGIEASWDGLRHFWYIGLTEECVRNRDEINEQLEDENAKLRELVKECHELLQDLLAGWALQPLTVKVMEQLMRELGIEVDV